MSRKASPTGSRVYLETPSRAREKEFLERVRASQKIHRPWLSAPKTTVQFRSFLKRLRDDRFVSFFVCLRETNELVGVINLNEIVRGLFHSAFSSYYAFAPFAGQGLLREGMVLALDHAFGVLGLHRVEANVQPGNVRSRGLVSGLGFQLEGFSPRYLKIGGRWRDHERWAILAETWPKAKRRRSAKR